MSILEKMKKYWFIILGVIIAGGLIITYFSEIISFLIGGFILLLALMVFFKIFDALDKSINTGFMGFFILLACATYNPNLEKFNSFLEKKEQSPYKYEAKVSSSDWVLFSIYETNIDSNLTETKDYTKDEKRIYIGILKNFWELSNLDMLATDIKTYIHNLHYWFYKKWNFS